MTTHNRLKDHLNKIFIFKCLGKVRDTTFLKLALLLFAAEAINQGYKVNHLPPEIPLQHTQNNNNDGNH